jgi:hypothetical protein
MMSSQIDLASNEAPKGKPRYFIGKEDTLPTKILARPSTFITLSTETNSNLAKLIFISKTASKHKNKPQKLQRRVWTPLDPTKPDKRPPSIKAEITFLNTSITITKRRGNNRSPSLKPLELLKIKKLTKEMQYATHLHHLSQNRISSTYKNGSPN